MKSCLENRCQLVEIEGKRSTLADILVGVPQGSILGPLLFLIFTNELLNVPQNSDVGMFADDSYMCTSSNNTSVLSQLASEDFNSIEVWCEANKLKLNADKSYCLEICPAQKRRFLETSIQLTSINGETIDISSTEKLLGVLVNHNLTWDDHLNGFGEFKGLLQKLSSIIPKLKKLSPVAEFDTRKKVANGIFMTTLIYAIQVWGSTSLVNMRKLQIIQNSAARIVCKTSLSTPLITIYDKTKWLTVNQLSVFHSILLLYKILNSHSPLYIFNQIQITGEPTRQTRSSNFSFNNQHIILPQYRLNIAKNSFLYKASVLWNQIPISIRNINNVICFKKHLKLHVISNIPQFV